MIEERIKVLSNYLSEQGNINWRVNQAFNQIVDHCYVLQDTHNYNTKHLERLASWYVDHILELNQDNIKQVSYEFVKHILMDKLKFILNTPAEFNYRSIENNIFGIDIFNGNDIKKQGEVAESIKLFVKDVITYSTGKKYERTQD